MKRELICRRLLAGVLPTLLLLTGARLSHAQVFLKPPGKKAIPIRVQSLNAQVEIIGVFAITKWQVKFSPDSPLYQEDLMEFVMARPNNAKLTALRVEQGRSKKLNGRVVENAVAMPRVTFPAAKDDPLYKSGLNANNSLRATIYPLSAWYGVAVSGTWVQVLSPHDNRATYRLPLRAMKGATTRLDELYAAVRVRDGAWQRVSSNFNLPIKTSGNARALTLQQKNYRVTRDLQINLARGSTPDVATMLYASNPAQTGGYFITALEAPRAMQNPQVVFTGLNASQTVLSANTLRAGQTLLITGLYEGTPKNVSVQIAAPEGKTALKVFAVQNAIAPALWATQKINTLSQNAKANRTQIIQLSREYSVASPFSSWLLVGDEDLRIYQRALVSSQLDPLVREWWIHFADGKENSARSMELKKTIAQISDANGLNAEDEIYMRLGSAQDYVSWQYYGNSFKPNKNPAAKQQAEKREKRLRQKMESYLSSLKIPEEKEASHYSINNRRYFETRKELRALRAKIMNEYRKPHPDYEQLKEWEHRFAQIYGSIDKDPRLDLWRARITSLNLESEYNAATKSGDKTKLAKLEKARIANSKNAYFVNNIGDPPIYVFAPADAKQVVAIMPDGQIKTLEYNARQKRWEGNYDIPTSMREGNYAVQIIIVRKDNSRTFAKLKFRVDTTPPTGRGRVLTASENSGSHTTPLRLEVEHGGDVARVTALLPWGEKVALLPSTTHGHLFYALAHAPREYSGKAIAVKYVLIDRAHNLTTIEAEAVSQTRAAQAVTR
jgi:hypothetical protein